MEELSPKRESAANPDPLKRGKQSFKVKKVSAQSMIIESSRRTSTFDDKTKLQKAIDAFYLEDESMVSDIEELTADERNDLVILKEQLALEKENKNQGKKSETGRVQKNQHSGKKSEKAEKGSFAGFSRFYRGMFPTKAHFNLFRTFPRVVDNLERPIRWKKTGDSNEKIAAIIIFNSNKRMWKESLEKKVFGSVKDFLQNKKFYENGHLIRTEDGDEEDEENVCEEEEEEEDELGEREERLQERVRKEAELREREERLQERVRKEAELREREERLQERVRKEAELLREREERLQERVRKEAELLQRVRKEVELLREREERLQEREERLQEREERLREREERIQQEESRKIKVTEARRNPEGTNKRSETMNHNELTKEFHHHRLGTTSSVSKMKFFDKKTPKPE